ncbi:MAG: ATP-binding protein [Acidobacteriaceae bacterium]|nr:ATP-binding protein [Acidobacteriaceae bacterium]
MVNEKDGLSAADRCTCVAETRAEELTEAAQIPRNYRDASFESFLLPEDNPIARRSLSDVMVAVKSFIRGYPTNAKQGLLLIGPTGTGKTHLAVAALRELIVRGHEGIFFDYQNLLERIRSSYNETLGASSREAYNTALEAEILLLDDLGAHRVTEWVKDTVTSIITYRCNHRKPLIATTNLSDEEMHQAISERAYSRLFEMCLVVKIPGAPDYRVRQAITRSF